jgi:hypothetical protein
MLLWFRSYWRSDSFERVDVSDRVLSIGSFNGQLVYDKTCWTRGPYIRWHIGQKPETTQLHWFRSSLGFACRKDILAVPYWSVVLTIAIPVAALWVPECKRFSLRTMLYATAFISLLLGLIVYAIG